MLPKVSNLFPTRLQSHDALRSDSPQHDFGLELQSAPQKLVLNGAFPNTTDAWNRGDPIEVIRDPNESKRLAFLRWNNGHPVVVHEIEQGGRGYVLPRSSPGWLADMVLPHGAQPSGGTERLAADLESLIAEQIELDPAYLDIIVGSVLSSWLQECFEVVPYLWLMGSLGSGKTQLLKLLACLCRRSVLVGDIRPAALYQLLHNSDITLLVDELELDGSHSSLETARLLRTGNTRGLDTVRNGKRFSTFCFKVLTSRLPPGDGALASRSLFVSMSPTTKGREGLDEEMRCSIVREFQPRLLGFRFENFLQVKRCEFPQEQLLELTPRMKQSALSLLRPLQGDLQRQQRLIATLRDQDNDARVARTLEPEWLVVESLYRICHESRPDGGTVSAILVGGLAGEVKEMLETRGEDVRFSAHQAGRVLRALGFKTGRIANRGRGLKVNSPLRKKIHQLARQFGLDRRVLTTPTAIEAGYCGVQCDICDEFGLNAGLRRVPIE